MQDNRLGEVVAASIIRKDTSQLNEEDIRKFCSGVVSDQLHNHKFLKYMSTL